MTKYLYLTRPEWALTWIHGGRIPISLASTYLSAVRDGTKTPDENLIHRSPVDIRSLERYGIKIDAVRSLTIRDSRWNGQPIPELRGAAMYAEDGLILSFCNRKSSDICARLGKAACIAIEDIDALKATIDAQLGVVGTASECAYTTDHQRNHFLKSTDDAWQDEYRMFWPILEPRKVSVPAGTGRLVKMKPRKPVR